MGQPKNERIIYWPLSARFWRFGARYAQGPIGGGLREGDWTFWYKSGAKQMAGAYKAGKKIGPWTKWWENGTVMTQGCFEEGRMHGVWMDFFADGKKARQTEWDHGAPCGETITWDPATGEEQSRKRVENEGREPRNFTLMTDRDVAWAVVRAQRAMLHRSWARLVGSFAARYLEPWHGALWLILLIPACGLFIPRVGILAVPLGAVAASLACAAIVFLVQLHDVATRADIGSAEN